MTGLIDAEEKAGRMFRVDQLQKPSETEEDNLSADGEERDQEGQSNELEMVEGSNGPVDIIKRNETKVMEKEKLDEDESNESKKTKESAAQTDPVGTGKMNPQIKNVEKCKLDLNKLRTVSRFSVRNYLPTRPSKSLSLNNLNEKMKKIDNKNEEVTIFNYLPDLAAIDKQQFDHMSELIHQIELKTERFMKMGSHFYSSMQKVAEETQKTKKDIDEQMTRMENMLAHHQESQSVFTARLQRMINDLVADSNEEEERLNKEAHGLTNKDERHVRETPNSDGIQRNDGGRKVFYFSKSNSKESPLSVQETLKNSQSLNTNENITRLIRNEINKLGLTNENKESNQSNLLTNEVKQALKIELVRKSSNTKRDYKLTS